MNLYKNIKKNLKEFQSLKEWDSSKILDAAFKASDYYGEDPDWNDVIDTIIDKMPKSKLKEYLKNNNMTEEEFYDGLEFADYDSVISGLENYLSEKDIKDIVDNFKIEDEENEEDTKQDGNKLSKKEILKIAKDKVDDLVSQNKMIKEEDKYFYIGESSYFKGLKYEDEVFNTLIKNFDREVINPLKKSGINISKSKTRNDYGSYDIDYYVEDNIFNIGLYPSMEAGDIFDTMIEAVYAEDLPYVSFN